MKHQQITCRLEYLTVILHPECLSGSDEYQRAVLIVVFAATVFQFHVNVPQHEQRIDFVVVQAAPDGRHVRILHHADQRMLVFQPHITAVVVGIFYFQYFGHNYYKY